MMHEQLFTIGATPITFLSLLTFAFILILSLLVAKGVQRGLRESRWGGGPALYGIARLSYYAIFLLGIYIALTTIGIDLTGIAVLVGALGVGIGFGLQAIFNNFVAGIILLLEKKVSIGDYIETQAGEQGEVVEVNVRTTLIETLDGIKIVLPNTEMIAKKVMITGKHSRTVLRFSLARGVEKEKVQEIALGAELGKKSKLYLVKLMENSAEYELVVWSQKKTPRATFLWDLATHFERANLKIAFS